MKVSFPIYGTVKQSRHSRSILKIALPQHRVTVRVGRRERYSRGIDNVVISGPRAEEAAEAAIEIIRALGGHDFLGLTT